jgi:hypothetical protein
VSEFLDEENDEVKQHMMNEFLLSCGLKPQHLEIFRENGFTELDILFEIEKEDLRQMKIPTGFSIKLLKKIKVEKENSV